jgi:hypothetical protein
MLVAIPALACVAAGISFNRSTASATDADSPVRDAPDILGAACVWAAGVVPAVRAG